MSRFFQQFDRPLIEALPGSLRRDQRGAMQRRGNAKENLSRRRLLGLYPCLFALQHVVLNGGFELPMKLSNRIAVKTDDRSNTQDAADKDVVAFVIFDAGCISFVRHCVHGLMIAPPSISDSRERHK